MTRYIGAIDQGTTSTRFIVFDRAGETIATAQMEHRQIYPQPGWVEHDPLEIWRNTQAVIAEALRGAGLTRATLPPSASPTSARPRCCGTAPPARRCITRVVWQDTRVDPLVAEYARDGGQDRFRAQTGLPLASYFSALKLRWLLDNVPDARRRAEAAICCSARSTPGCCGISPGMHVTDVTNASRTQLMNLATLDWDDALLAAFDIPRAVLPRIVPSSAVYGTARGVLDGVPIAGILGDQQAALMGQACFAPGEAKNTYGTGCFLLMNTGDDAGRRRPAAWSPPSRGSSASNGRAMRWKVRSRSPARWCSGCATTWG